MTRASGPVLGSAGLAVVLTGVLGLAGTSEPAHLITVCGVVCAIGIAVVSVGAGLAGVSLFAIAEVTIDSHPSPLAIGLSVALLALAHVLGQAGETGRPPVLDSAVRVVAGGLLAATVDLVGAHAAGHGAGATVLAGAGVIAAGGLLAAATRSVTPGRSES